MKILFLVEDKQNETASNLINAFEKSVETTCIDVISYFSDKKNQCTIGQKNGLPALLYNGKAYAPSTYDAALLWSWGTADLGRKYLRIFEDNGVPVLNSSYATEITDSKIHSSKQLENCKIPTPETLLFETSESLKNIDSIAERLAPPPYVFKSDYSTQGSGIRFASSIADIHQFAKELQDDKTEHQAFLVQKFIGKSEVPIFHYRVFVVGDYVVPTAIKLTAQTLLCPSNSALGGSAEFIEISSHIKELALKATQATNLTVAGVDIMTYPDNEDDAFVIEVNDGPGTKTLDRHGEHVSDLVVDYFVREMRSRIERITQTNISA